jgi:hypothetical protein
MIVIDLMFWGPVFMVLVAALAVLAIYMGW